MENKNLIIEYCYVLFYYINYFKVNYMLEYIKYIFYKVNFF